MRCRAVIPYQGGFILIHRIRPEGDEFYSFPGGGCEPGETLEQTVVRECMEELGIVVKPQRELFVFNDNHVFLCDYVSGTIGTGSEPLENERGKHLPEVVTDPAKYAMIKPPQIHDAFMAGFVRDRSGRD